MYPSNGLGAILLPLRGYQALSAVKGAPYDMLLQVRLYVWILKSTPLFDWGGRG